MRYELGDRLDTLTYLPSTDPSWVPPVPVPPKPDHKAKFIGFDQATGDVTFEVPTPSPEETPLAAIIVVFVLVGQEIPSTAQGFLDLPTDTCPQTRFDVTSEHFGGNWSLARPEGMQPRVQYLGQAIHGYND